MVQAMAIQAEGAPQHAEGRPSGEADAAMTAGGADDRVAKSDQQATTTSNTNHHENTCNGDNNGAGLDGTTAAAAACTTTVTPPPADQPTSIPPGLLPSDQGTETALSWLRRSEASLAALNRTPTDVEYLLGADFRDVCVEEFWAGGNANKAAASLACLAGANGDAGFLARQHNNRVTPTPADAALARHEMMERRRRKWRANDNDDAENTARSNVVSSGSNKRRRGGAASASNGASNNGRSREEEDEHAPSSIPPILSSVRRGCGLSFVDLALLHPAGKTTRSANSNNRSSNSSSSSSSSSRRYPVMEVRGQPGTGKTRLLLTLAANYVASTSVGCYLDVERVISDCLESNRRRNDRSNDESDALPKDTGDGDDNGNGKHMHTHDEDKQKVAGEDSLLPLSQDSTGIVADASANTKANTNHNEDDDDTWAAYGLGGPTLISRGNNYDTNDKSPPSMSKSKPIVAAASPIVVILDSDLNVHSTALVSAVRAAVLRRWGETTDVRQLLEERGQRGKRMRSSNDDDGGDGAMGSTGPAPPSADANDEEWRRIQSEIYSALSRIHVVKTNSGEGLYADAIPVLESLRHSLDLAAEQCDRIGSTSGSIGGGNRPTSAAPPTLLIIDSLTSSERRSQRLEALGSGLSGQNDFYRQLNRLLAAHPVSVVGTSTGSAATMVAGSGNAGGTGGRDSNPWSKMVTARVGLDRKDVATENASSGAGAAGYDYQALVPVSSASAGGTGGSLVAKVPFKIDSSGIWD